MRLRKRRGPEGGKDKERGTKEEIQKKKIIASQVS